jgi:hypothetical protein
MSLKNSESKKLFILGLAFVAIGGFLSYGIVIFAGAALIAASLLPPSGRDHDPL